MQYPGNRRAPDRSAALAQYRRRAAFYDQELAPFEPIRTDAIGLLRLESGQAVIDAGCGTGLSFEMLEAGIGPHGRIVGVDLSPEMLARARDRVKRHGWRNVQLVCEPMTQAPLGSAADAVLFHFTHDVVRDPLALAHVFSHLRPGARVVATGLQWAPPWMWPVNGFVMAAALYSVTSFEGLGRPWDRLAQHLTGLEVETAMGGGIYIAHGFAKKE
jgi:SAM-dependent methyltransferase